MAKTKLEKAIKTLTKALKKDKDYRRGWTANIAMAQLDAEHNFRVNYKFPKRHPSTLYLNREDKHTIANTAAENFIGLLCKKVKK